jgi:WD40 repeat protein/thiol-disulfide isomerase/thioredoxin
MTFENETQEQDNENEAALTAAEREVWGPFVDAAHEIAPRPEFAAQLEARLLAMGQLAAATEAEAGRDAVTEPQPASPRANRKPVARAGLLQRILQSPGTRFAMTGVVLGVVMVAVLAVMALGTASRSASSVAVRSIAPKFADTGQLAAAFSPLVTLDAGRPADITNWQTVKMEWSPDGQTLATADVTASEYINGVVGTRPPDQTFDLKLWDVATGRLRAKATYHNIESLKWSPNSTILAVGFSGNLVKLLDLSGKELASLQAPVPTDERSAQGDGSRPGWDIANSGFVRSMAWSPDGRLLATAAADPYVLDVNDPSFRDGVIRLWDGATGGLVRSIQVHNDQNPRATGWASNVKWSPDGTMLAASSYDYVVRIWDPQTGKLEHQLTRVRKPEDYSAWQFAWSPDSQSLAIAAGRFAELWSARTGQYTRSYPEDIPDVPTPAPTKVETLPRASLGTTEPEVAVTKGADEYGQVFYVAWSPDGKSLAAPSVMNHFRMWDVATGKEISSISPDRSIGSNWNMGWEMSPDWRLLASISTDLPNKSVKLWDPLTGRELRTLVNDDKAANFAWAADGSKLAVSTNQGLVIWGVPAASAEPTSDTRSASDFLPPGKVRHLVITHETSSPGEQATTWTEDVWLAAGDKHPLMKKTGIMPGLTTLVGDQAVWTYGSQFSTTYDAILAVYRTEYDEKHFDEVIPNKQVIDGLLKQPNTQVVENTTLDGRPVMVIESTGNVPAIVTSENVETLVEFATFSDGPPIDIVTGHPSTDPASKPKITVSPAKVEGLTEVIDYRLWIDSQTYQVVQQEYTNRFLEPKPGDKVVTYTRRITLDELKDAGAFPTDLFTFKQPAGTTIVDAYHIFAPRLPQEQAVSEVSPSAVTAPSVGAYAPDFELPNVRPGSPAVKLSSLRGKPVILTFWGTWCAPCRAEMPELQWVYDRLQGQIEAVGVSMGPRDEPAGVNQYLDMPKRDFLLNKHTWIFVHDADSSVMTRYKITGVPSTYFIDRGGVIRAIVVGGADAQTLESHVQTILAGTGTTLPPAPVATVAPDVGLGTPPAVSVPATPSVSDGPPRIPLVEFKALYDDPAQRANMLIIDVRAKESYDAGHIKGSESWPESDIDATVVKLPKDKLIVAYCQ